MKHRLRKKDRIKVAGLHCNRAIYMTGKPKKKWVLWREKYKIK